MVAFLLVLALQDIPTEEEALDAARQVEASMVGGGGKWLDQNIDVDELLERALGEVDIPEKTRAAFGIGFRKTFSFGKGVATAIKEGGSFKLLRTRIVDGKRRMLFRMLQEGDFNYHDYLVLKGIRGGVRFVDVYIYSSGELLSATLRRSAISALGLTPGGRTTPLNEYFRNLPRVKEIQKLNAEGEFEAALKKLLALPEGVRREKSTLVLRCTTAAQVGLKEAMAALEAMKEAYPGDPCLSVLSINPYVQAKKYDLALAAVDDLEKQVGIDAHLHDQRATIHMEAGEYAKAKEWANKAIAVEKDLASPFWTLVTTSLQEKAWGETAKMLARIEKELGLEMGDLTKIEIYAGFVKSPEHKAWLESRKKE